MKNLDYGIIGNCTSAALISKTGSIEWLCLPDFDSSSEFAKILDRKKGGEFGFQVSENYTITQFYHPYTNILKTRFECGPDIFEVIDFMPMFRNENGDIYNPPEIIRYIHVISGSPSFRVIYEPRLNYAISDIQTDIDQRYIKSYTLNGTYESIYLYTDLAFEKILDREKIKLDGDHFFMVSYNEKLELPTLASINLNLQRTEVYWLNWVDKGMGFGKYRDEVVRSALVLRLLTFSETGAIIAAVTTSIPETIGEVRNWDYRFCWIRDSGMIVRILRKLGYQQESADFLNFVSSIIPTKDEKLQIMYGIRGEKELTENTLDHLSGYQNSTPVRIGNAAYTQRQHDIVGVLMDVIYQEFENYDVSSQRSENLWTIVRSIMMKLKSHWMEPDKGIWEIRNEEQHFVFSKVLAWTGADRGIKIARLLGMDKYLKPWSALRDAIRKDVLENGWDEELQAFTQYYGSRNMDAANLLIEHYGFIEANDPKYISTVLKTREELMRDGLMYRYINEDDFGIPSSSFTICTFWMIQSLYKIGEKAEAKKMFDHVLSCSNYLGLFSEDIDFKTKRLLGNFPQGYSHLALIETALLMDIEKPKRVTDTVSNILATS
ncbi:MAG: glycoside hydrolase family 15 protein [Cyclobacteriaceae bacterium]|nr:glycoside hydrolase family 15 protein [Cyclobacteriaceae bacterium]